MAGPFKDEELLEDALAAVYGMEPEATDTVDYDLTWEPKLNPTQNKVYKTKAEFVLSFGERGTGKTFGGLHKLVHHCVYNRNALAFVIVREVGQATDGGAWHKLNTDVLPTWKYGNYDRIQKRRVDSGMGIEYTAPKFGVSDKKPYVWIRNIHGGWSMVILISLFVGEHVEDKVKGKEPSFILFDEAQTTDTPDYFNKLVQQLGRRQDIETNQPIVYCCNPKGPSHWLYQTFFIHQGAEGMEEWPIDDATGHPISPNTGKPKKDYAIFHVPIHENIHNLPAGYWERVQEAVKNDPIERARMVDGEWIDKPEGDAIFRDYWKGHIHVKGNAVKSEGLTPLPGYLFITSWDPGSAHSCVTFEQFIVHPEKTKWLVFDELNYVGRYIPYGRRDASGRLSGLVPKVIERMKYWEEYCGTVFRFVHISDNSAFNQFRARDGSFDVKDIEEISQQYVKENKLPERYIIKMKECPKGPHSVAARVRLATDLLLEDSLAISATCARTIDMFINLEEDKDDRTKPRRSKHLHSFDAFSYAPLYYQAGRGKTMAKIQDNGVTPMVYSVGGR